MTRNELESRWHCGAATVKVRIVNIVDSSGKNPTYDRVGKEYQAPLGDFLAAYHQHLGLSWWRRGWDWGLIEKEMREALNVVKIEWAL